MFFLHAIITYESISKMRKTTIFILFTVLFISFSTVKVHAVEAELFSKETVLTEMKTEFKMSEEDIELVYDMKTAVLEVILKQPREEIVIQKLKHKEGFNEKGDMYLSNDNIQYNEQVHQIFDKTLGKLQSKIKKGGIL